eukprot:UN14313
MSTGCYELALTMIEKNTTTPDMKEMCTLYCSLIKYSRRPQKYYIRLINYLNDSGFKQKSDNHTIENELKWLVYTAWNNGVDHYQSSIDIDGIKTCEKWMNYSLQLYGYLTDKRHTTQKHNMRLTHTTMVNKIEEYDQTM